MFGFESRLAFKSSRDHATFPYSSCFSQSSPKRVLSVAGTLIGRSVFGFGGRSLPGDAGREYLFGLVSLDDETQPNLSR